MSLKIVVNLNIIFMYTFTRCLKMWKQRARKWKKSALSWKAKYSSLYKKSVEGNKLQTKFRKDQLSVVTGKVKKVKEWSKDSITEGLRIQFACGSGYEQLLKLPYVALPSVRTLVRRIQEVHFDTGKFYKNT